MDRNLSRRQILQGMLGAGALSLAGFPGMELPAQEFPPDGPNGQQRGQMNRFEWQFNKKYAVPALSLAIARNGKFVYDRAIGTVDKSQSLQAQQNNLFRIASVTKPITSVAVFTLIEAGKLSLNDKVFGPSGVFGTKYGKMPYKQYVQDITVDHLLTHTCGGWPNDDSDPMMHNDGWDHSKLISETIQNLPLTYQPGTHWAYSNVGYCLLGRVIEQVSGQAYADYVKANVLGPCGITDMAIAQNKEKQRYPNEVVYYGQYGEDPYKLNVTRMDSHGGWVATPSDLVMFLNHLGGFPGNPSLLKPETIAAMTTPCPVYPGNSPARYARGWMIRTDAPGTWWHNGSLPGTTTIMVRAKNTMCWAGLTNTRSQPSDEIDADLDRLFWTLVREVPKWGM